MRTLGSMLLAIVVALALGAPVLAPHTSDESFRGLLNAPPTMLHVRDDTGRWRAPFIYPWTLVNQLEQRYEEDRAAPITIRWGAGGHIAASADDQRAPLLLLGADSYGRDVFSRLLFGARVSIGLSACAAFGALLLGAVVGGVAGYAGRTIDDVLMRASDFVLVLPGMYVALALRSVLPLVLAPAAIFVLLAGIFAIVGAPLVARGVRAIVRSEGQQEYAAAAIALGAGHARVLVRHLLPAARGFLGVQMTVLVPAFIVAEATLSYVGLGFPDAMASWGTMLHDASNVRAFADFPWLLSPGVAIFVVVFAVNLVLQRSGAGPLAVSLASGRASVVGAGGAPGRHRNTALQSRR